MATMPTPEKIAGEYAAILATWLTPAQMAAIQTGNAWPDDFCDANEALAEALERHGVSLWTKRGHMRESARKLWNNAFDAWLKERRGNDS